MLEHCLKAAGACLKQAARKLASEMKENLRRIVDECMKLAVVVLGRGKHGVTIRQARRAMHKSSAIDVARQAE